MRTILLRALGVTIGAMIALAILLAFFLRGCGGNNTPPAGTPAVSGTEESQELKELRETVKKLETKLAEKSVPSAEQKESLADKMLTNLLKRGGSISKDGVKTDEASSKGSALTEEQERLKRLAKEAKANARNAELSFGIDSYTARVARQKAAEAELIAEEAAGGNDD